MCHSCGKFGHFLKVCKQKTPVNTASIFASVKSSKKPALETVEIDNKYYVALIDSGSQKSFISGIVARSLGKKIDSSNIIPVTMASSDLETKTVGAIQTDVKLQNRTYKEINFSVLNSLCYNVILGEDFMKRHSSIIINYGGWEEKLSICVSISKLPSVRFQIYLTTVGL